MAGGRADDRKRPRRGESSSARRTERSAPRRRPSSGTTGGRGGGKRPGGQSAARPQPSTGGAFKLSSTRRAAVLAILVCAMALSVSVPLRTYISQREELAMRAQQQAELKREVQALAERKAKLTDPQYLEAQARKRLGYVRPGETPYVVRLPPGSVEQPAEPAPSPESKPWYQRLWNALT